MSHRADADLKLAQILAEAGLEKSEQRVLDAFVSDPALLGRVDPPAGYEAQLLRALNAQLPPVEAQESGKVPPLARLREIFALPSSPSRLAWSVMGVALLLMTVAYVRVQRREQALVARLKSVAERIDPILADAAHESDEEAVREWLNSLSDQAGQWRVARRDTAGIAQDVMDLGDSEQDVEKKLSKLERALRK